MLRAPCALECGPSADGLHSKARHFNNIVTRKGSAKRPPKNRGAAGIGAVIVGVELALPALPTAEGDGKPSPYTSKPQFVMKIKREATFL